MAFQRGQLSKMTIIFYPDPKLPGVGIPFHPMYNPESYSLNHAIEYDQTQRLVDGNIDQKFLRIAPKSLDLELFFDGTNTSPSNLSGLGIDLGKVTDFNSVVAQVELFLTLGARITSSGPLATTSIGSEKGEKVIDKKTSDVHRPFYMMIIWGTFLMTGVLEKASVTYTMFNPEGVPIRAKMNITIAESFDSALANRSKKLASPDLSKAILIKEGDTLPDLCFQEYGDSSLYIKIAEVNKLKNFRKLTPGTELLFPPIK